jgi:glycosyltransferase involved in cell wall biosynthesis
MSIRVAVVTSYPKDLDAPRGGVQAVSVNLIRALRKFDDLDLHVVTLDEGCRDVDTSIVEQVPVHRVPAGAGRVLPSALGAAGRRVREVLTALEPQVVHAHDVYGLMVRALPVPRVFTVHGFIYADTRVSGERFAGVRSRIWRHFETRGWASQPHIIAISPYVRERISTVTAGMIHDIDNPIAESFYRIDRRERSGTVFCAALVEPRKNTIGLVEAIARVVASGIDVRLRLAGAVRHEAYHRAVLARIEALHLEDRVVMLGPLALPDVQRELAAASVCALLSLEENAPLAVAEAMAAGVPVVASNRCGMPYMIRHGESGYLVDPTRPSDAARRVADLLGNDVLRARMGRRSREIAEDRFHPDRVGERTRDVYYEACAAPGAASRPSAAPTPIDT